MSPMYVICGSLQLLIRTSAIIDTSDTYTKGKFWGQFQESKVDSFLHFFSWMYVNSKVLRKLLLWNWAEFTPKKKKGGKLQLKLRVKFLQMEFFLTFDYLAYPLAYSIVQCSTTLATIAAFQYLYFWLSAICFESFFCFFIARYYLNAKDSKWSFFHVYHSASLVMGLFQIGIRLACTMANMYAWKYKSIPFPLPLSHLLCLRLYLPWL